MVVHASIFERRGFSPTRIAKSGFQKLPTAHPGAVLGRVRNLEIWHFEKDKFWGRAMIKGAQKIWLLYQKAALKDDQK